MHLCFPVCEYVHELVLVCTLKKDNQEGDLKCKGHNWLCGGGGKCHQLPPLRSFRKASHKLYLSSNHTNRFPDKLWGLAPIKSIQYTYVALCSSYPDPVAPDNRMTCVICSALTLSALVVLSVSAHASLPTNKCTPFSATERHIFVRTPVCFIIMPRLSFIHSSRESVGAKKAFRLAASSRRGLSDSQGLCSDHLKGSFSYYMDGWDER